VGGTRRPDIVNTCVTFDQTMNIPVVPPRYYLKPSVYCMYRCVSHETNSALFPQSMLFLYCFQEKKRLFLCTELPYLVL